MKIIFLDIDGVLNNYGLSMPFTRYDGSIAEVCKATSSFEGLLGMDYDKVNLLNYIMDNLEDWDIVVSSSWGYKIDKECRTQRALRHFGFKHLDRIIDSTEKHLSGRGQQILYWVDGAIVYDFITIEDEPFDITGDHESVTEDIRLRFEGRVFQPYCDIGLTKEIAEQVINRCKIKEQ